MANALHSETSRYLLGHKDQPVHWLPWGDAALALAQEQNKPILLSIGYSTCHWCHVMARESFADTDVAALMNERFVNIKVDREERPDLDEIYQTAHQLLTGRPGGWPLTVFLCPRTRLPFIAGTYYRKHSLENDIGFLDLLQRVHDFYHDFSTNFSVLRDQVELGFNRLAQPLAYEGKIKWSLSPLTRVAKILLKQADHEHGGFGSTPKFPMVPRLEQLYRLANSELPLSADAETHLAKTLTAMAQGGIADPVSGGFFRYATDANWQIPHFEKMLCDNGQLLRLYTQAWNHFGEPLYAETAAHIARWAMTDMCANGGAFYSAVDADYQGIEGAYYVFDEAHLQRVLSADEYALMSALCGWENTPNYSGFWHLHCERSWSEAAELLGVEPEYCRAGYRQACEKLLQLRHRQPAPGRDEKIKTGWNALMIRGLVSAARYLPETDTMAVRPAQCLAAAQIAMDFMRENLWLNKRLFATWQGGRAKISAYADDYVYLMAALLDLLQVAWRDEDYRFLIGLAESLQVNFEDQQNGGFFYTPHDHEKLIYRSKPWADGVLPSANGLAAEVFLRLGQLAAEPRYTELGRRTLEAGWHELERQPEAHQSLLVALEDLLKPPVQVLLYGDSSVKAWRQAINDQYAESVFCYWVPLTAEFCPPEVLVLEANTGVVCTGDRCLPEQASLDGILEQLLEHFTAADNETELVNESTASAVGASPLSA